MARNDPILLVKVRSINSSSPFLLVLLLLVNVAVQAEVLKAGLWGSNGGSPWNMPAAKRLLDINIRHGAAIDAITILYEGDQKIDWTPRHGGGGGDPPEITFQTGEYITSVSGHYIDVVRSLTSVTNHGTYGPYGSETGTPFSLQLAHGKIVGFFGQSGAKLDAIGVYFEGFSIVSWMLRHKDRGYWSIWNMWINVVECTLLKRRGNFLLNNVV